MLTDFATKTEQVNMENVTVPGYWPIGIDYGFSGIKCFSPNKVFCFPNCAVELDSTRAVIDIEDTDIILRDEKLGTWLIGERALVSMDPSAAMNYEAEMYGRNRYASPIFAAVLKAGIALALTPNGVRHYTNETIVVQTGLPPKFRREDTPLLRDAIAGEHSFEMRVGNSVFRRYHFNIAPENIYIIDQPMGSLISAITADDAIQGQADIEVLKSNTLVFDPGFKTLDIYDVSSGLYKGSSTFDNLGMYEVFTRTVRDLNSMNASITVPEMQSAIRRGFVRTLDIKTLSGGKMDFSEILQKNSDAVCKDAIKKILSIYNYLRDYDYLVVTGGGGNAWFPMIAGYFSGMTGLSVISANRQNPSLSNTYSNVRGYYLFLIGMLRKRR